MSGARFQPTTAAPAQPDRPPIATHHHEPAAPGRRPAAEPRQLRLPGQAAGPPGPVDMATM